MASAGAVGVLVAFIWCGGVGSGPVRVFGWVQLKCGSILEEAEVPGVPRM